MNLLKNRKFCFNSLSNLTFFVILMIGISFIGHLLERSFSQGVYDEMPYERPGDSTINLGRGAPESVRTPFMDWLPEVEQVINETIIDIVERVYEPELDTSVLRMQGIVWGVSDSRAIINDKIYRVGDEIEGAEIVKLEKKGVTLLFYKKEYLLTIPELIKMEVANETYEKEFPQLPQEFTDEDFEEYDL